jgi:hypothetical protein
MRQKPATIARERARLVNSHAFRAAEKKSSIVSVCLIGYEQPVPRYFGDNQGGLPVRVVVTSKERTAAKDDDSAQPYHRFVVLESVHIESRAHGDRLKAALDNLLLGEQQAKDNKQPRHRFRDVVGCFDDVETRSMWWGILLAAALREVRKQARDFEIMDNDQCTDKIARARGARGRFL